MKAAFSPINTSINIMDWSPIKKGWVICFTSSIIGVWMVLLLNLIAFTGKALDIPAEHSLNPDNFIHIDVLIVFYVSTTLAFGFIGLYFKNKHHNINIQHLYMYWAMLLYTFGNIGVCHFLGELSLASGIMLAGAPIIGWILFDNIGVIICMVSGLIICSISYLLTYFGILDYAPIAAKAGTLNNNTSYLISTLGLVTPHVVVLLFMAYHSIKHWKAREAHANHLAGTDTLTNVPNRRQLGRLMLNAIRQTSQAGGHVSALMLDIDNFKTINDNFGHHAGDQVLGGVIDELKKVLRQGDIIGRFGGDEFVIVLPKTDTQKARAIAERMLAAVRNTDIETKEGDFHVTASFGLYTIFIEPNHSNHDSLIEHLLKCIDTALYKAKQAGRDCLHVHEKLAA